MGFGHPKSENNRVNEADTKHATLIPESYIFLFTTSK